MELRVVDGVGSDELLALRRLLDAAHAHDDHDPLGEHKWLDLVHDGTFKSIFATLDRDLVGYAHLSRHAEEHWGLVIVTHPSHRDGLEVTLAERALRILSEAGGGHLHYWVFCPRPIHEEIASKLGLRPGRDLHHVCVRMPVEARAELPPGVTLRAFEGGRDEQAWLEVNNRAFDHHPEQGGWDAEMLRRRMDEPWFDPDDLLVATDDAGMAGFNWTKLHHDQGVGEIYVIGVDPSRQNTGLGKALTLAGLEHMARRGMHTCCLYVDAANEAALRMYERIGFTLDHVDRAYVKDVARNNRVQVAGATWNR